MPCFHFDLQKGEVIDRDDEGAEFADVAAARIEAIAAAKELLSDAIRGSSDVYDVILVTDCDRNVLASIPMAEVLPPSLKARFTEMR